MPESVLLEGGGEVVMEDDTEITCTLHNVVVKYGDLNAIQQLAFLEGIDTLDEMPCILTVKAEE